MEGSSLPALLVQLLVTETATNGDVTPTATKTPRAPDVWGRRRTKRGSYISADWTKKTRISRPGSDVNQGKFSQTSAAFVNFFKINFQNANQKTCMETHRQTFEGSLRLPTTGHFPAANTTPRGCLFCFCDSKINTLLANNHI